MGRVAVITDSASNIPRELVDSLQIGVAPISVIIGDKEYQDGVDIDPDEFYHRMKEEGIEATTSGNIIAGFLKIFEELKGKVDGIVAVVLSSYLPSTGYSSALTAVRMEEDIPVEVVDSRLVISSEGLVVLAAARAAAAGADMAEVARVARETIPRVYTYFTPKDLRHFKRLGRFVMPGVSEEELLKIRPILTFRDGKIVMEESCTPDRTISRILELVYENARSDSPLHLAVMHAGAIEEAEKIKRQIISNIKCDEVWVSSISPAVGTHTGPGTLGVTFYNE